MTQLTTNRPDKRASGILAFAFQSRRKIATACAITLAAIIAYHVVVGQNGLTAYEAKRREAKILDAQLEVAKQENARMKLHVDRLRNDPAAIEHEAREQLHYVRPGEVIYTIPASPERHNTAE